MSIQLLAYGSEYRILIKVQAGLLERKEVHFPHKGGKTQITRFIGNKQIRVKLGISVPCKSKEVPKHDMGK
jgi:hypothetical protein